MIGVVLVSVSRLRSPRPSRRVLSLRWFPHELTDDLLRARPLLQPLSIPQSVEGVVGRRLARRDTRNHHHSAHVSVADEGVTQHHCQLVLPERDVLALGFHGSDALLQSQQRLVDLGALLPPVLVVRLSVLGPLGASQVDQQQLSAGHSLLATAVSASLEYFDGADGMRPTGCVVAGCGVSLAN